MDEIAQTLSPSLELKGQEILQIEGKNAITLRLLRSNHLGSKVLTPNVNKGWLMKRGQRYDPENDEKLPKFNPRNIEGVLKGKTERKRYFVLLTSKHPRTGATVATLLYFSHKPNLRVEEKENKDHEGGFAKLINAEISQLDMKGKITITSNSRVVLVEGVIRLVVPGRTYYLRPCDENSSAQASIQIGQWVSALNSVIRNIWKGEHQNVRASKLPMLSNGETFHHSNSVTLDRDYLEECPDTLEGTLASEKYSKRFEDYLQFNRAEENIDFYNVVTEFQKLHQERGGQETPESPKKRGMVTPTMRLRNRISFRRGDRSSFRRGDRLSFRRGQAGQNTEHNVPKEVVAMAKDILNTYILLDSPRQVNISSLQSEQISMKMKEGKISSDIFDAAKQEIFQLMEVNFFMKFYRDEMKRSGGFQVLFNKHDLHGYQQAKLHFGPAKLDVERLLKYYQSTHNRTTDRIKVIGKTLKFSHSAVTPEQETLNKALLTMYSTSAMHIELLASYADELKQHVLVPLQNLVHVVNIRVENIDETINNAVELVQKTTSEREESRKKSTALGQIARIVSTGTELNQGQMDTLQKYGVSDVSQVEAAANAASELMKENQMIVQMYRDNMNEAVLKALDQMESLELHRLEVMQSAMRFAIVAERDYLCRVRQMLIKERDMVNQIDAERDAHATAIGLVRKIEESGAAPVL